MTLQGFRLSLLTALLCQLTVLKPTACGRLQEACGSGLPESQGNRVDQGALAGQAHLS